MSTFAHRPALILLALGLLAGCGPRYSYHYRPPATAEGTQCVAACDQSRSQCLQQARDIQERQRVLYEADLNTYNQCMYQTPSELKSFSCHPPQNPIQPMVDSSCEQTYDQCYQTCGGTIERTLIED